MRNKETHAKQCMLIDRPGISVSERSHYSKVYGINRSTVLMELSEFDVTKQLPQDLMHVILEGIFPLHMKQLLTYIVQDLALLSLNQINSRIVAFPYAYFEEKPSPLTSVRVQGAQSGKIMIMLMHALFIITHCLASQMWQLVNLFPFVIGAEMSTGDPHYACFMLLNDIARILFSHIIARDQIPLLSLLIKEYLENFAALYPHRPLTPKCHYLLHTPTLIAQ